MQILLFLLLFVTNVAYGAVDCGNPPTCAELGFSQTVQECTGRSILRCMLDMANDNAVYCGDAPAGDSSVPETPTCDLTVYYMNETMCSVEGVKCVQCENPEQSEYYMFDGCEDNYWQTSNIAEWCCHNDFNISGACPTGGNCSVCGNMNRLDSCEEGYHMDGNTCVADGIDCDEDYFNLMACPTNGNCEECRDLIGRTVYHLESCMTGYHKDGENDACCDSNLYNLDSCPVSEDEGTCASCGGKYRLIGCNTGWVKSGDDCLCDTSIYDMTSCPTGLDCESCTDDVNGTINSFKGCLTGYHLNTAGDGCCNSSEYNIEGDCPENGNCNECGGKKKLTGCADGYHVEGNACVVDEELCNIDTYPLTSCPTNGNCNECEDTSMHYQLESCKTGYAVSENICICDGATYTVTGGCPTNGNCNSCTDQNGTKYELYACETGFVKSGDVCVCDDAEYPLATCPDNTVCKTCDDNHHKFVECNAGYWWDGDSCEQTCASLGFGLSSCPENGNCSDCTDDTGTRLKLDGCVTDYHVEGDVCVSDTVPCDTDVYNKTECPLNGTCNKCSDTTGDHFEFTGCNQGYKKYGEGCLCDTAIYPTTMCATNGNCTSCDDVSGTTRYKLDNCNSGYWKTDDGLGCCPNDHNLSECPDGGNCGGPCGGKYKFLECLDGYWWDGDSCEAVCNTTTYPLTSCPANGSCNECEDTSKHYQFNNCNAGYWWDGDSCEQTCASLGFNLSSCPENGTCTDCEDNIGTKYKVNDCDPDEYPLAACGSGAKCSVCTDTSDHYKFDECLSGYWLDGSNCKSLCNTSIYNIAGNCPANGVCDTCTDTSKHSWLKSCNSGYYKDGNVCKPLCDTTEYNLDEGDCPTGGSCSSCTDPVNGTILKFDECGTGYHLNVAGDGCCDSSEYNLSVKPEHASSESCGGKYKITGCNTGYVLSGDNCICDRNIYSLGGNQCPSYGKCNSCTDLYGTYKQFTGCQSGYHLNDAGNGCCSSSTYSLSSCPDKGNCSSCGGKYKLDSCDSPTTKSGNSCICSTTTYPLTSCPENGVCNTTCKVNGVTRMKLDSCNSPYTKSGNSCICSTTTYPLTSCPTKATCSNCGTRYKINSCATGYTKNAAGTACVTYCEKAIASNSAASLLNSNSANDCGNSNKGICVLNNNISITNDSYYPSFTRNMRFEPCSTYDTGRSYNSNLVLHGGLVDMSGDTIFNVAVDAYGMATNGGHVYFNQNTSIEVMTMYDGNIFVGNGVTATINDLSVEGNDLYVIVGKNSSLDVSVNNNGNQITFGIISGMSSTVNINGEYFDDTYLSDDCQEVGGWGSGITVCKYDEGRVDAPGYVDFGG